MKRHNWVGYSRTGDTLEIIVKDYTGAKLESWEVNCRDKKRIRQIARALKEKFSIDLRAAIIQRDPDIEWMP